MYNAFICVPRKLSPCHEFCNRESSVLQNHLVHSCNIFIRGAFSWPTRPWFIRDGFSAPAKLCDPKRDSGIGEGIGLVKSQQSPVDLIAWPGETLRSKTCEHHLSSAVTNRMTSKKNYIFKYGEMMMVSPSLHSYGASPVMQLLGLSGLTEGGQIRLTNPIT
ncbi:hypothetical protein M514_09010 [Trichuris suis]|uniref:Uncharacterized protein n=1 Tax=Trichuris suis TaxID=68888 RepID=A0A085MZ74_9BILA|nr:hypothetical protein M514_09010 [Trichuris suis]